MSRVVKIYVDEREKQSRVPKYLMEKGVTVIFKQLPVGDYIPAEGIIIERKRLNDLIHSVFQGRFFDQVRRLVKSGMKPVLLIEGDYANLYRVTDRHKAIEAAVITAAVINDLPVIYSRNARHTAEIIQYIAEKNWGARGKTQAFPTYRKKSKPKEADLSEWQLYILASFPGIGPTLAERLLRKFGSLKEVINASPAELSRVEGMSEEKALTIHKISTYPCNTHKKSENLEKFLKGKSETG